MTSNEELAIADIEDTRPLDVDGVTAAIAGTVAFAIGFVVLLFLRPQLAENNASWWLWVCATGTAMGLVGVGYTTRRRAAYRAAGRTNR